MTVDSLREIFIILAICLAGSVTITLGFISFIRTILAMAAGDSTRKWVLCTVVLCSAGPYCSPPEAGDEN